MGIFLVHFMRYEPKHWLTLCIFAACLSACLLMTNLSDSGSDSVIPVFAVWKLIKGAHNACKNYQGGQQCLKRLSRWISPHSVREYITREKCSFFNIVQTGGGGGGQTHVQKLCCKFCIVQRAIWQHKLKHRKDV